MINHCAVTALIWVNPDNPNEISDLSR